ncbi:MAG: hypothetical protein ACODAD_16355, partial [Planctomycetota bacterium]
SLPDHLVLFTRARPSSLGVRDSLRGLRGGVAYARLPEIGKGCPGGVIALVCRRAGRLVDVLASPLGSLELAFLRVQVATFDGSCRFFF